MASIWYIADTIERDSYSGSYDETIINSDYGYFTSEEEAKAFCEAENDRNYRQSYERYKADEERRHAEHKAASEQLAKQNAVLRAAGLPEVPGTNTARFSPSVVMDYEKWLKYRAPGMGGYLTYEELEPHRG